MPHTQGYRELGNPALGIPGVQARARANPAAHLPRLAPMHTLPASRCAHAYICSLCYKYLWNHHDIQSRTCGRCESRCGSRSIS